MARVTGGARLAGGRVDVGLVIAVPTEVQPWILGWGRQSEVLSSDSLRESIAGELEDAAAAYAKRRMPRSTAG